MEGSGVRRTGLPPDARYLRLPRPAYQPHPYGVRPGAASALAVAGGLLLAAAPFGAWLRVTGGGNPVEVVSEQLGWDLYAGPVLLLAGAAAVAVGPLWRRPSRAVHRVATGVAAVAAVAVAVMLVRLQSLVGDAAETAVVDASRPDVTSGAGWGAWAGVAGAASLATAVVLATLARSERRKPEASHDAAP